MNVRRLLPVFAATAILLATTALVFAGTGYTLSCPRGECGYKGDVRFGGGFRFHQLTGYCANCADFVYLRWPRKEDAQPPEPLASIWDPRTGRTSKLYACPDCGKAFLALDSIEDLVHCPKCNEPGLTKDARLNYD